MIYWEHTDTVGILKCKILQHYSSLCAAREVTNWLIAFCIVICCYLLCVCVYFCRHDKTKRLYCVEWTQYSIRPKRSAICNRSFPGPTESWTQTIFRSIPNFLQGSLDDRPTDRPTDHHATWSFTIGGIYLYVVKERKEKEEYLWTRLFAKQGRETDRDRLCTTEPHYKNNTIITQ